MLASITFGPFRLDRGAAILFHGADPTALGRRAVDLLAILVEASGTPVGKETLISSAWQGQAVEDSNLTVQMAAIRRTLAQGGGAGWIETLPRRGYRYVGPLPVQNAGSGVPEPSLPIPDNPSIAVMPFANLSHGVVGTYFIDGMIDDIITGLSRISWLFVIARNSTLTYRDRPATAREIGRNLGVRYILEGSVRGDGNRLRVACQLVDTETGAHAWAERFDQAANDIFVLQDDIAQSVVGAIAPGMRRAEFERIKRQRPDNLDAYDLVLQAQPDVDSGMPARVSKGLVLLERALSLEPDYPLAHANAAMCHHCLYLRGGLHEDNRVASVQYARSALLYGADDATALTLAAFSLGMDGHDRIAAFTALDSALAISPSSALTYILGSVILGWAGEAERALEWSKRGVRLSPFDPWTFAAFDAQAMSHFARGRYEEASRAAYRSVHANPAHSITYVQLAAALAKLGRLDAAKAAAARVLELHPSFRYSRQFAAVNCDPTLAAGLGEALEVAGLPS
jgi:TolB-like protein/tetratricopeptide (TPR) repeat protein